MVSSRSGFRRSLPSHRSRLLRVVFGSLRFTWPTSSLRESQGLFGYFFSLAVRHTPCVIPTIKYSFPFVLCGSWEGAWLILARV